MYYRLGDKVKFKKGLKPTIWDGMTGRIAYIKMPNRFGMWGYGIKLDYPDIKRNTKVIMVTMDPFYQHKKLIKLDSSKLHPKFINCKKFKFK